MGYYDRDYYRPTGFGSFSFFPPVIKNLLIINGAIFFIQMLMKGLTFQGVPAERIIIQYFSLMPLGYGFEIWQLISYQFLHGNFSHILFNMFALWMFGVEIENIWGSKKFLVFYLICGVGAGMLHLFASPLLSDVLAPTIGASGAVYGIMIAFALFFPNRYIFLYFLIPVKAKYLIGFLMIFEFLAVDSAHSNVAHLAHLGGALVGFIYVMLDKGTDVGLKATISRLKRSAGNYSRYSPNLKKPTQPANEPKVVDADFYEVDNEVITQEDIDKILDKISQSGYKNLSEREKQILFEASKRMR